MYDIIGRIYVKTESLSSLSIFLHLYIYQTNKKKVFKGFKNSQILYEYHDKKILN